MQSLGNNERPRRPRAHRGSLALAKRPPASVSLVRRVGENHFPLRWGLDLAGEGEELLDTFRVSDLEMPIHLAEIEDGNRKSEGQRDRVTEIDQTMKTRQIAFHTEATEKGLGGGAILRGLHSHLSVGAAPGNDLRELRLRALFQPFSGAVEPGHEAHVGIGMHSGNDQHSGDELWKLPPQFVGMAEIHG